MFKASSLVALAVGSLFMTSAAFAQQAPTTYNIPCPKKVAFTKFYEKALAERVKSTIGSGATDVKVRVKMKLKSGPTEALSLAADEITSGAAIDLESGTTASPLGVTISGALDFKYTRCEYTYDVTAKASGKINGVKTSKTSTGTLTVHGGTEF